MHGKSKTTLLNCDYIHDDAPCADYCINIRIHFGHAAILTPVLIPLDYVIIFLSKIQRSDSTLSFRTKLDSQVRVL